MYSKSGGTSGLIKVISGLLATLLLTPMLIFTALPNTVFGYNSATNQGIADFTASAQRLTNAYQDIERKKQSALDRLVNTILPGFFDYDDYQVTDGSGGMNQNWLIAIGSVRYKQDLNVMDDDALEELLYGKLDYSASVTDRVLNISVWDLTPEAYMDRLGFSQEEKDWASLLYSVMAEEQRVTVGDTDGPGHRSGFPDRQQGHALRCSPVVGGKRRALRHQYDISLTELELVSGLSNQYISRAELGEISPTAQLEEKLGTAIEAVIARRLEMLISLGQSYTTRKGYLLQMEEGDLDE